MTKAEFEKARDGASEKYAENEFKNNSNGITVAPYVNSHYPSSCFEDGADWAHEYTLKHKCGPAYIRMKEKLQAQDALIDELESALDDVAADYFVPNYSSELRTVKRLAKEALQKIKKYREKG